MTSQGFWNSVDKLKEREQADSTTKPGDTDGNYMDSSTLVYMASLDTVIDECDMSDHD